MVRQNEDLSVVKGDFCPTILSKFRRASGPRTGPNIIAAHNPRADIVEAADGEIVVNAGGAVFFTDHALEGASGEEPLVQSHGADAVEGSEGFG